MLRPFASQDEGRPYAEQVKPFNFVLSAQVAPFGHPEGADPERFHLVASYEPDARCWSEMEWTDLYSGRPFRITMRDDWFTRPDQARVKTYRDIIADYRVHPEEKSLGFDGKPSGRGTVGLLSRRVLPCPTAGGRQVVQRGDALPQAAPRQRRLPSPPGRRDQAPRGGLTT